MEVTPDPMEEMFGNDEEWEATKRRLRTTPAPRPGNVTNEQLAALREKLTGEPRMTSTWLDKAVDLAMKQIAEAHDNGGYPSRHVLYDFADRVIKADRDGAHWKDLEARHVHGELATCHCGEVITWDADMATWWIPYKYGNPLPTTFDCPTTGTRHSKREG